MALFRAVSTIGSYTLVSRIFGFFRDTMVANYLGAGFLSDAFLVAFKLPNFLRRLFAEGAFNSAFVPLFAGTLEADGPEASRRFAEEVLSSLALILLLIVLAAEIFMPLVVLAFAPGFDADPAKFDLSITLSRLTFPYIFLISIVTLFSAILNSLHKFAYAAIAPILLNLCMMGGLYFLSPYTATPAHALAIGVSLSGVVQCLFLAHGCRKAGLMPRFVRPRFSPPVKRVLKLAAPSAFGAGVAQVNLLVDIWLASSIPGAVSWIYYADRINELPIGVIGVAISTALLPLMTRAIRGGNHGGAVAQMNNALSMGMAVIAPATVGMCVLALPLTMAIFEHGAFTARDTAAVVPTMIAFSLGLPAFVLVKVFGQGFYAREDTKTPVKIGLVCLGVNLFFNLTLIGPLQHVGLATATSIAAWVNVIAMAVILHKRGHFVPDPALISASLKSILASLTMAAALLLALHIMPFERTGNLHEGLQLVALVAIGGVVYAALAITTGIVPRHIFRRKTP